MRLIPSLMGGSRYRAGDWVIVRSRDEILTTLDAAGCCDGMPFQPEMLEYCGRRMQVFRIAHKTCDYSTGGSDGRRVTRALHLVGGRCDGQAHAGCQAHCYLFWKDDWLRADAEQQARTSSEPATTPTMTIGRLQALTQRPGGQIAVDPSVARASGDDPIYVCQTTVLRAATTPLAFWDARQYIDDVTSRNLKVRDVLWLLASGALRWFMGFGVGYRVFKKIHDWLQARRNRPPFEDYVGPIAVGAPTPGGRIDVKVGDSVEVLAWPDIEKTLNQRARNRGMKFDYEMVKFCGERHRVEARVDRIIDERSGRMLTMKEPCIQLENVHCMAECTADRLGCPRRGRIFWRENWLKRVDS
jgi:hypothetical protein